MEQKYKSKADAMRQIIELAVCAGRHWQGSQTGFIQYCYNPLDEDIHTTAPVYENFLFTLALMRSRSADNFIEAKTFLERLLNFQQKDGESAGNFPVYLHEYSLCKNRLLGAHILAPLYWIHKNFHHLLGTELKAKLEGHMRQLADYCLRTYAEKSAPYHLAWLIGSGTKGFGELLKDESLQKKGQQLIDRLLENWDEVALCNPHALADLLVAFQMTYSSLSKSLPEHVWQQINSSWHLPTCTYCGPGFKEYYRRQEPQPTLFDFFMGYFAGAYSYRIFADHPVQLLAALVHPSDDLVQPPFYPVQLEGSVASMPWKIYQTDSMAYSYIAKQKAHVTDEKTFVPLSIFWGDCNFTHSFVCQGGNIENIAFTSDFESITLSITLANTIPPEHREKRQEISFYFNDAPNFKTTVNSVAANTFQLEDHVSLNDTALKIGLDFAIAEGEGRFFGHLMKGNRPAQTALVGRQRFEAYDWHLFLRSVERTAHCVVTVKISLQQLQ